MPSQRPAVETTIGGRRFALRYFTPSEALPLMGRLVAFLGPVLEGAAGEATRALLAGLNEPDQDVRVLLQRLDLGAVVAGTFRVRWGEPVFMALARDVLAPVIVYDGAVALPLAQLLDGESFAGPEGLQTLVRALGWATWSQFGLPLFSTAFAGASLSGPLRAPPAADPQPAPTSTPPASSARARSQR